VILCYLELTRSLTFPVLLSRHNLRRGLGGHLHVSGRKPAAPRGAVLVSCDFTWNGLGLSYQ